MLRNLIYVALGVALLGCGSQEVVPSASELTEKPAPQDEGEFLLGLDEEVVSLPDGTQIVLFREGSEKDGLLTHPGLKVVSPKHGEVFTGGLGLFDVHERPMFVERLGGDSKTPPHLKVTIGRPDEDWALMSVDDAIALGLKELRDANVGYSRFGWRVYNHRLELMAHLDKDPNVAVLVVDRFRNRVEDLQRLDFTPLPFASPSSFKLETANMRTWVEVEGSTPASQLAIVEGRFVTCRFSMERVFPSYIDVLFGESGYEFDYPEKHPTIHGRDTSFQECLSEVLQDVADLPPKFRINFEYKVTTVEESASGDGILALEEGRHLNFPPVGLSIQRGSADTRNGLRKIVRKNWMGLIKCEPEAVQAAGMVEIEGTLNVVLESPWETEVGCLTRAISRWNLGRLDKASEVDFSIRSGVWNGGR